MRLAQFRVHEAAHVLQENVFGLEVRDPGEHVEEDVVPRVVSRAVAVDGGEGLAGWGVSVEISQNQLAIDVEGTTALTKGSRP